MQVEYPDKPPARTQRPKGTFSNILRRLAVGETAVLQFGDTMEATSAQATIRVTASRLKIPIETYRPAGEPAKVCIVRKEKTIE